MFFIKAAKILVVEPPMTVDLSLIPLLSLTVTTRPLDTASYNLGSTVSRDTRNDENDIPVPKRKRVSRQLRSPAGCCGSLEVLVTLRPGSEGFLRSQTLSGLESKKC